MLKRLGEFVALVSFTILLAGCSFSSAAVTEAAMSRSLDDQGRSIETVTSYPATADRLMVSAYVAEVSKGTHVRFVWNYVTKDMQIGSYEVKLDEPQYTTSYVTMEQDWPLGDYRVDVFVDNRPTPDQSISFTVEEPASLTLDKAVLCTALNMDNSNYDIVNSFDTDAPEMCISVQMSGLGEEDIPLVFVWENLDTEETIHTQDLTVEAGSESTVFIGNWITGNGMPWEPGRYGVGLKRQDGEDYLVFLNFEVAE